METHSDGRAQASSNLIGLGAGGHAKVLIEILQAVGIVEITGLLDDPSCGKPGSWA